MNLEHAEATRPAPVFKRLPIYYGWVTLTVAALAMVGTLPGRTQGLGLITEPLLRDLQLDRVLFAQINLWATLIGSLLPGRRSPGRPGRQQGRADRRFTTTGRSGPAESILAERGFDAATYHRSLVVTALMALIGNFLGGWLTSRWKMNRLMALAMGLLGGSLLALPHVQTQAHVSVWAGVMGLAGGFVMVIFFTFWGRVFGRAQLGRIQGAAQTLTVLASAIGPLLLAECVARTGSYSSVFYSLAMIVGLLGLCAWLVTLPSKPGNGRNSLST